MSFERIVATMSRRFALYIFLPVALGVLVSCERACSEPSPSNVALPDAASSVVRPMEAGPSFDTGITTSEDVDAGDADDEVVLPAAPMLAVTTLAKGSEHLFGVAFDATYVYAMTAKGAARRVPRAGGAINTATLSPDGGFADILDHAHAYYDGENHPYQLSQATVTSFDYVLPGATSIGVHSNNGAGSSVAKSLDATDRKALVMDKKNHIVWLEPALHAVIGADGYGTKLHYILDTWSPAGADLAIVNDRVLLLDVRGRLVSAKLDGADMRLMGDLSKDLGAHPRTLWLSNDSATIFVTCDSEDGSRVLAIDLASVAGAPLAVRNAGLVASQRLSLDDASRSDSWLRRRLTVLDALADGVKEGAPIVLSLDRASTDAKVDAALTKLESFLRSQYGAKAKITRAAPTAGQPVATSIVVGIERSSIASLFQP